jgi:hypothetical protein
MSQDADTLRVWPARELGNVLKNKVVMTEIAAEIALWDLIMKPRVI